ncbi:MAG TPA: VacJ family lipoprotein [Nitrosospira sp.]
MKRIPTIALLLVCVSLFTGCATLRPSDPNTEPARSGGKAGSAESTGTAEPAESSGKAESAEFIGKVESTEFNVNAKAEPAGPIWKGVPAEPSGKAEPIEISEKTDPIDPNEKTNRKFYEFTDMLDRNILAPVADVYIKYVPNAMQRSIGNFYDNLGYPNVILNDFLQGKVRQGFQDSLRFVINSTIGGAGLFDMAGPMGLPQHDEDFGQTLGVWGFGTGSYIFVPLLGPSSYRDAHAIPVSFFSNVLFYAGTFVGSAVMAPITILSIIDKRARLSGPMRIRDQAAVDPYLFVREGFLQQRKHLIYDGDPPPETYDDLTHDDAITNEPAVKTVAKPSN